MALLLGGSILVSSCIGSFPVFHKVLDWNRGLGDRFVNELVFIAFNIIPVYPVTWLVDFLVTNSIEFWSGQSVACESSEILDGATVQRSASGYSISKDGETVNLVFNEERNSWNMQQGDEMVEMIRFNPDGTATLANGKTVSVNAAGIMQARMSADKGFIAER